MRCPNCDQVVDADLTYCPNCGANLHNEEHIDETIDLGVNAGESAAGDSGENVSEITVAPKSESPFIAEKTAKKEESIPSSLKPISMFGYIGLEILSHIPIIGLLFSVIYSFGATKNRNITNYARAKFCWTVLWFLCVIGILVYLFICGISR